MSHDNNRTKDRLLGIPHGTANNKLRKNIIFYLANLCRMLSCYRCKQEIESVDDLSIEHMTPWQGAPDPKVAFFDISNIAFSHLKCNIATRETGRKIGPDGTAWCGKCEEFKSIDEFRKSSDRWNGLQDRCRNCRNKDHNIYRHKVGLRG